MSSCVTPPAQPADPTMVLEDEINNISNQFIETLSKERKSTVAILDFVDLNGTTTMLGKYLREEITVDLFRSGRISVVERNMLDKVMAEWNLSASGFIDEETAVEIGHLLGVETIATGSITDLGNRLKVNARIIDVADGALISVASGLLTGNSVLDSLLDQKIEAVAVPVPKEKSVPQTPKVLQASARTAKGLEYAFTSAEFDPAKNEITLYGTVESLDGDATFSFNSTQFGIVTDPGNNYTGIDVFIGNKKAHGWGSVDVLMLKNIKTQISIKFNGASPQDKQVLRADYLLRSSHYNEYGFSIRTEIPIE